MTGSHNSWSLVIVSVLYGIFSGACKFQSSFVAELDDFFLLTGLSLAFASLASLARTPDEIGYVAMCLDAAQYCSPIWTVPESDSLWP
jgi:hypothetical protein